MAKEPDSNINNMMVGSTPEEDEDGSEEESSLDKGIANEEEVIARIWSPYLYSLQKRAPKSRILPAENVESKENGDLDQDAADLGLQYHGLISKADAIELLSEAKEGTYLVRRKTSGSYIVSFKYSNTVYHYVFKRHEKKFLYADKEFNSVSELVDDNLIMLYLEQHDISKHLTLGRAKAKRRVFRRKNVIRTKHPEDDKNDLVDERRKKFGQNSSKSLEVSDTVDGVYRELSSNDTEGKEPVKVFVEDEKGPSSSMLSRQKALSEKIDRKKFNLRIRKKDGGMAMTDRKSCPQEIVNLLSIYTTKAAALDSNDASTLDSSDLGNGMKKSPSSDNLPSNVKPGGAIGQLLRSTLSLRSDENLSKQDDPVQPPGSPRSRTSSSSSYGKSHNFKVTTYTSLTWCDLCHHFLWGLVQQGIKCQDCGINIHKQCMEDVQEIDCIPKKELVKRVYGVDLTTLVIMDNSSVPKFLKQSMSELELRGLQTEGIYRVPGRTSHVMEIKDKVDDGDINFSLIHDVHVIGASIKLFLRELPIPLITFDAYSPLLRFIDCDAPDCSALKQLLIDVLPKAHYDTLHYVTLHLTKVARFSDHNKMLSSNLAVVFAPTIMRSGSSDTLILADLPLQKKFIQFLIDNCLCLFGTEN